MQRFISGRPVLVPGLLLIVLGLALSIMAVEHLKWHSIRHNRLTTVWVGQDPLPIEFEFQLNKCCKKGAFTSCKSNVVFSCSALPLVCNPGEDYDGSCANHSCTAKPEYRCGTITGQRQVDLCRTNGGTTATGCPNGQMRCDYVHYDRGTDLGGVVNTDICATGSNLCPNADQPATPCDQ